MDKYKKKSNGRQNNFYLNKKDKNIRNGEELITNSSIKANLVSKNTDELIKDLMEKEKISNRKDSRPNKTFNVDFLSRNSTNLVSGPETERKKIVKDIQLNEIYQESFLRTKYSCELIKNGHRKTEENFNSLYPNNRSDILYLKDIIFNNRKDTREKGNNTRLVLNETNKKKEALPKIKTQRIFSNATSKKNTKEFKMMEEKVFTQTMETYYSKLSNLKPQTSGETKLDQQIQDENSIKKSSSNLKISAMFGNDQTRDVAVKEELSIFKNLHSTGDRLSPEKSNLSNFVNLSKRKSPSIKSYEITFKKKDKSDKKSMNKLKTMNEKNKLNPIFSKNNYTSVELGESKDKFSNFFNKKIAMISGLKKSAFKEKRIETNMNETSQQQFIENKFNFTSSANFKKIEDYKVNVEEIPDVSFFEHENKMKIKVIKDFLSKIDQEKFHSENIDYRKIYVVLDGTIIINTNRIPGRFINIIKRKIFKGNEFKKKRNEYLYNFLCEINKEFNPVKRIRNIFLMDGTPVFDLLDIPDNERCVLVSHISSFRSILLSNSNNIKFTTTHKKNKSNELKLSNIIKSSRFMMKKKKKLISNKFMRKMLYYHKSSKKEYLEKYEINFKENTFVDENISVDDWEYRSDNEMTKTHVGRKLHEEIQSQIWAENKERYLRSLLRCDTEGNLIKPSTNENKSIESLVDDYNQDREKRSLYYKKEKKDKKDEPVTLKKANEFMKTFIKNLGIIKQNQEDFYDEDMLNEYQQQEYEKDKKHIIKNKQKVSNLYFQIDRKVNKLFPDLIRFNIPKLLATYPSLTRKELFELFVQYKSLMKICIALNKSMKILNKGVDFRTFHQGVSQMSTESEELAKKIFNTINVTKNNYLSWEEFLKGMITIKSESISDKIDMFFKIIDTDGNGLLSYEEVLDLSLMSLKRNIKGEDNASLEIINELAKYFADLIFKLVDVDKDDEIPLPKIKEKIIEGGEEAAYLEMFCCADNFKGNNKITFN